MHSGNGAVDLAVVATHIAPSEGFGGIAVATAALARAFADSGRSFRVCASDASLGAPLKAADLGLPATVPVQLYRSRVGRKWGLGLGAPVAVARACIGARVVLVQGLGTWPTLLAKLACAILRRPMLVAPHAGLMQSHLRVIEAKKPLKRHLYRMLIVPLLRRAHGLCLTSRLEEAGLDDLLPGVPLAVVPNGVDLSLWRPLPPRNPADGRTFCYFGRFSPEKGIRRFLRVWRASRRPGDRLLLAGVGDGAYGAAVMMEARSTEGVSVLGWLDLPAMQATLLAADALVLPSGIEEGDLRENFGNVVAEALACSRPVLVAEGLAWDHAEREGFGIVFGHNTDSAIAAGIERFQALSPETLAEMGRAGRRYAEAHLDVRVTSDRIWDRVAAIMADR